MLGVEIFLQNTDEKAVALPTQVIMRTSVAVTLLKVEIL